MTDTLTGLGLEGTVAGTVRKTLLLIVIHLFTVDSTPAFPMVRFIILGGNCIFALPADTSSRNTNAMTSAAGVLAVHWGK